MTTDPNTEWDYEKLQEALSVLEDEAREATSYRSGRLKALALRHCIEFVECHMREGNVVSPTETYLTMK